MTAPNSGLAKDGLTFLVEKFVQGSAFGMLQTELENRQQDKIANLIKSAASKEAVSSQNVNYYNNRAIRQIKSY